MLRIIIRNIRKLLKDDSNELTDLEIDDIFQSYCFI